MDSYRLEYRDIESGDTYWTAWDRNAAPMTHTEALQMLRSAQVAAVRDGLARDYRIITGKQ